MATTGAIITWGRNIAGREEMGLGIFMAALQYYNKLKGDGALEGFDVFLTRQGVISDLTGAITLRGSDEQINALLASDEHKSLLTKAVHVVANLTLVTADTGDNITKRVEEINAVRAELGIKD